LIADYLIDERDQLNYDSASDSDDSVVEMSKYLAENENKSEEGDY